MSGDGILVIEFQLFELLNSNSSLALTCARWAVRKAQSNQRDGHLKHSLENLQTFLCKIPNQKVVALGSIILKKDLGL